MLLVFVAGLSVAALSRLAGSTFGAALQAVRDTPQRAAASGLPLMPVVIEQEAAGAPADGLARAWPAPDTGVDTHRVYMMQWYAFAALAGGLWIGFAVRRRLRGRGRR